MKPITVLISDDHNIVRQGLRQLLAGVKDIEMVGEAENGHEAIAETVRLRPDVVVMDLAMPLLNGLEATRQIARSVPSSKVLVLSSYRDDQRVKQAVEAGAAGYVIKETAGNELLLAIREVHRGNAFFSPLIFRGLLKQWKTRDSRSRARKPPMLSVRQLETLRLIAGGHTTRQIAVSLSIKIKTAEKHRQSLMDKLDIHNIATLTHYAVSHGVLDAIL